jgi:transposase IS200 family protein
MLYTVDVAVMLRSNSNVTFQCAFHVVWCPKYRRPVVGGRMEQRLTQLVGEVIEERGRGWWGWKPCLTMCIFASRSIRGTGSTGW